jgi:hypothetical protein
MITFMVRMKALILTTVVVFTTIKWGWVKYYILPNQVRRYLGIDDVIFKILINTTEPLSWGEILNEANSTYRGVIYSYDGLLHFFDLIDAVNIMVEEGKVIREESGTHAAKSVFKLKQEK